MSANNQIEIDKRVCTKCLGDKPLSEFYENPSVKSGYQVVCKPCFKERNKKYKSGNPEAVSIWQKVWIAKHQDWVRIYNNASRAEGPPITLAQWNELLDECGHCCAGCGVHESESIYNFTPKGPVYGKLTIDHIYPVSLGGTNGISNLQPLCLPCNMHKYTKVINFLKEAA